MNTPARCAACGAELPADSPQGLCAACLLKRGLATETADTSVSASVDDFVPPTPAELAAHFPDLEILEFVGRGGMGMVYKARQRQLDRLVALKILLPRIARDQAFADRFAREARAMAMLSHANIVAVYDFGQTAGTEAGAEMPLYWFLMEYVDGLTLRDLLQQGKLAPREALAIVPQICEALQYAHDSGLVHRDIKPANILLDKRGRVKIADFGLAKLVGRPARDVSLTGTGQVMGTPHYMAPEQIEHPQEVDHRADIYSLGVVFYQMLTGELPLGRFAPPSKKVAVDVRLDEVVLRALEREPELRYQRASQVKTEVETIEKGSELFSAVEPARAQVRGPALGLLATGLLNWLLVPMIGSVFAYVSAGAAPPIPRFAEGAVVAVLLAMLLVSSLMIFAALKMKRLQSYRLAVTGSVLAMIISPGNVIGLPIGIWSLVVLTQPEVRAAFRRNRPPPGVIPARLRAGLALFFVVPAVFIWFLLAGHPLFQVDLDADVQFFLGLLGLPLAAGAGALLAWAAHALLTEPTAADEASGRRWSWPAVASVLLLVVSLPFGGAAMVFLQLLRGETHWNPGPAELAITISAFGGAALLAAAVTALGLGALRRIRHSPEPLRGHGLAQAAAWFWPVMLVVMAISMAGAPTRAFPRPIPLPPEIRSSQGPGIDRVIVKNGRALVAGRGSPAVRIVFCIDKDACLACRFPSDSAFAATAEATPWGGALNVRVVDAKGNELLSSVNTKIGPMQTVRGRIHFEEGTPAPRPDGAYVIAEFRPETGRPLPITVSLGKL